MFRVRVSAPAWKWQEAHACTPSPPVCMSQKKALPSWIAAPRFATKSPRLAGKGTGARRSDCSSARAGGTANSPPSAMASVTVVLMAALDANVTFMCEFSSDGASVATPCGGARCPAEQVHERGLHRAARHCQGINLLDRKLKRLRDGVPAHVRRRTKKRAAAMMAAAP